MNVPFKIEVYDKRTEHLLYKIEICRPNADILTSIFGFKLSDMQEGGLNITELQADKLNKEFLLDLEPSKRDYQLDCDSRPPKSFL